MPIYAYRCEACGFRKDVLQKMSDPALSVCPSCGAESFAKQLSAPAFQLKGTGWYATDFRDKAKKPEGAEAGAAAPAGEGGGGADGGADKGAAGKGSDGKGSESKSSDGKSSDARGSEGKGSNGKAGGAGNGAAVPPAAVATASKPATKGNGSSSSTGTTGGGSGAS